MNLKLSPDLEIPPDAAGRTFGILAVRGAGKSNTAAVMAEEMFAARLPFVVVDPVGSWYGLRSNGDGTGPGLAIPIFGGKHGDIQVDRNAGELLADLIVEKRLSCVLDLSRFASEADKKFFLLKFAQRLYEKNEDPLHLFLEEADDYIPQKPMPGEAYLLRAWENIVRRGRARGLGMTLITQRSAAINKMVLTQVETLIAMRTTGPQDIAAIEAWVKYHDVKGELLASLSSLPDGDAWVWSPQFLGITKRVHIRRRRTFDSGATPKNLQANETRRPATLADVDLQAIRTKMAETEARAKADDPKQLRKEIVALKQEISALKQQKPETRPVSVLTDEDRKLLASTAQAMREGIHRCYTAVEVWFGGARRGMDDLDNLLRSISERVAARPIDPHAGKRVVNYPQPKPNKLPRPIDPPTGNLTGPEQRILDALAELEALGIQDPPRIQVALFAGYAHLNSKGFANSIGRLKAEGRVEYGAGTLRLLEAGRSLASQKGAPRTEEELHRRILALLDAPAVRILTPLIEARGGSVSREDLVVSSGYGHANSKGFANTLGRMRSLGLIDYPERGTVRARDILFLEG